MNAAIRGAASVLVLAVMAGAAASAWAQPGGPRREMPDGEPPEGMPMPPPGGFPGGPGGPGAFGGPGGGPNAPERKLVKQFDKDGDGRLNSAERAEARKFVKSQPGNRRGPGGPGGPGGRGPGGPGGMNRPNQEPATAGPRVAPSEVKVYQDEPLYDTGVLRTIFLNFENDDWAAEMADFHNSDVEVPATMIVDGKTYKDVGVHYRGASSYFMVGEGYKKSLNVSMDYANEDQRLLGYKTLNLLNANGDPSLMSTVLYSAMAKGKVAAPKANFVRVVINGESWGVFTNVQQFDKIFVGEHFTAKGDAKKPAKKGDKAAATGEAARWKVKGSPQATAGLEYLGEEIDAYRKKYEIKSKDNEKDWHALIDLCRVLNTTPAEKLEDALRPMLDIDGALWFLALDVATINSDGYWVRSSDYSICRDAAGVFHIVPHDMNEAFRPAMGGPGAPGAPGAPGGGPGGGRGGPDGPGGGGGRAGGGRGVGVALDPLVAIDDDRKPLRSKLLKVPSLRAKYLQYMRQIAERDLDWANLGKTVSAARELIREQVKLDTRKATSTRDFESVTADSAEGGQARGSMNLRAFAEQRRAYLLKRLDEIAAADAKKDDKDDRAPSGGAGR